LASVSLSLVESISDFIVFFLNIFTQLNFPRYFPQIMVYEKTVQFSSVQYIHWWEHAHNTGNNTEERSSTLKT